MVIDPNQHMTYQPFLPEAAAGNISPRHGVVPLRQALKHCTIVTAGVTEIRHAERKLTIQPFTGPTREIEYDEVIIAPGSVSRPLPIPGLAEIAIGIKTMGEAIWLRNHVLQRFDIAATTDDPDVRRKALTFVTVGGGFAGAETLGELEDLTATVVENYPEIDPPRSSGTWSSTPTRSCPRSAPRWAPTRPGSSPSAASTSAWAPPSSPARAATSSSPTARSSTPTPSSGPPGSCRTRC
ncbi:hypothetical protein GCM10029992_02400 [Glycomyces albus]